MSEPRVVRELILKRSEKDVSYLAGLWQDNQLASDGVFPLDEDALCTYIDLDRQIDSAGLSPMESTIVDCLMQGYSLSDTADYLGHVRQAVSVMFDRAVEKIVARNNQNWEDCYSNRPISQMGWTK